MKDLGEGKNIIDIEIIINRKMGRLCLTQKRYLKKVVQRFSTNKKSKSVITPLAPHFNLSASLSPKSVAEQEYMSKVSYVNAVSSLMYVMVCTMPDISQAVGVVSMYMHNPGKEHW